MTSERERIVEELAEADRDLHRLDLRYHEAIKSPYITDCTISKAQTAMRNATALLRSEPVGPIPEDQRWKDGGEGHVRLRQAIQGAIKTAIHDHGPIDKYWTGSAVKRVYAAIKLLMQQYQAGLIKNSLPHGPEPFDPEGIYSPPLAADEVYTMSGPVGVRDLGAAILRDLAKVETDIPIRGLSPEPVGDWIELLAREMYVWSVCANDPDGSPEDVVRAEWPGVAAVVRAEFRAAAERRGTRAEPVGEAAWNRRAEPAAHDGEREPDAMCHATQWRMRLASHGLTVRPYDPNKMRELGPPWPVWIGGAPPPTTLSTPQPANDVERLARQCKELARWLRALRSRTPQDDVEGK